MGESCRGWECGGRGEEVGTRRWALAFSSGIFLSVVLSFLFFLFAPLSLRGWRHGYQGSLGTDNMAQTMASSPRWWWEGEGRERERGRPGQGHRGREGQNSALVCRARTLYSITPLALSLSLPLSLSFLHTHTFSLSSNAHTTLISPF